MQVRGDEDTPGAVPLLVKGARGSHAEIVNATFGKPQNSGLCDHRATKIDTPSGNPRLLQQTCPRRAWARRGELLVH